MELGERLLNYRKEKHLSQEEVADKLNVSRQTISKWETGSSTPDFDKIGAICELYGISADELINGTIGSKVVDDMNTEYDSSINNKKKKGLFIGIGIFTYFLAIAWIMITVAVFNMNPVIASAIFLVVCGLATIFIVYACVVYVEKKEKKKRTVSDHISGIIGIVFTILYFWISFATMAWHITWILWIVCGLVEKIVKLIFELRGDCNEK